MDVKSSELRVLFGEDEIQSTVKRMASEISRDYQGKDLVVVCVLKGSFIFCADLVRNLDFPLSVEFLGLSSYGDATESSGRVKIELDVRKSLEGKDVLVVEDIIDTGNTLDFLRGHLENKGIRSLKLASLFRRGKNTDCADKIDYVGFVLGDEFIVGYGLDYAEIFRNLPYVGEVCLEK